MAYHNAATPIYAQALPLSYQLNVEALFHHCSEVMDEGTIPAALADSWSIVDHYLLNAAASIRAMLGAGTPQIDATGGGLGMDDRPPPVIRYDQIAALTTLDGIRQLEMAAESVRAHVVVSVRLSLDDKQRMLLQRIAEGMPIATLASEMGYSQRSIFRELSGLWETLGVPNRATGVRMALEQGLID